MARPAWIEIGYVARSHGLRGAVRVRLYNASSKALEEVPVVHLEGPGEKPRRSYKIVAVRLSGEFGILELEDVSDRTRADALIGAKVWVSREALSPLEADEYYHFELIGLRAMDEAGVELGRLEEIFSTPANDIYVVRGRAGELMVPAIAEHVQKVDLEAGTITLARVADLIEA